MVAHPRQHGKGQHHHRDIAVPAVPGAGFVVVEAEFVLGSLETVLDRPASSLDSDQGLDRGSGRAPGGEEGQALIADVAADQQAARPKAGALGADLACAEIGELQIRPVIEPCPLRALTGG